MKVVQEDLESRVKTGLHGQDQAPANREPGWQGWRGLLYLQSNLSPVASSTRLRSSTKGQV